MATTKRRVKKIPILKANNLCVKVSDNLIGFVFNVYPYQDRAHFQLLKFPSMINDYHEIDKSTKVEVIPDDELTEITKKYGPTILQNIPNSGCSLGSDPEVFVVDEKDVIIPAFKFLGDKSTSVPVNFDKGHGVPFWDGFQAEFTTDVGHSPNPSCLSFTIDDIRNGLREVLRAALKVNPKAKLTWRSVLDIPNKIMREAAPEHRQLGCAPSKNVYPHIKPISVDNPTALPFRFAGCHLHLGFKTDDDEAVERLVKTIDAIWGVVSVCLFRGMEDKRRRVFYGRAGEYRTPSHGIEYRTTSSAALAHPVLTHIAFDIARSAGYIGLNGLRSLWIAGEDEVAGCINEYDVKAAETILKRNKPILRKILLEKYNSVLTTKVLQMINKGALEFFDGLTDMEKVWRLRTHWANHASDTGCSVYNVDEPSRNARGHDYGDTGGINDNGEIMKPTETGRDRWGGRRNY